MENMKHFICFFGIFLFLGCAETPKPTGNLAEDLQSLNKATKAEKVGVTYQINLPFEDGLSKSTSVTINFQNVSDAVRTFALNPNKPDVEKVMVMLNTNDIVDSNNQPLKGYLMSFDFSTETLQDFNFKDDFPFQILIPKADIEYKQHFAKQMVKEWCTDNSSEMASICKQV